MAERKPPIRKPVQRRPVAVLGSSKVARQFAYRPARLTTAEIGRLLVETGPPIAQMHLSAHHATLSAQVPWVEDRGYLNLVNPQSFFADDPNVGFISPAGGGGNVEGVVEVWLLGLETGASYLLEFVVGSYGSNPNQPGQWKLSSSTGAPIYIQATGPGQSLPLVLLDVSGPMQLAKLTSQGLGGWVFYEVVITRLD
jgi:hypothetical protein